MKLGFVREVYLRSVPSVDLSKVAGKLDTISEYWNEKGKVIKDNKCDLIVAAPDGTPLYYYFVSSRTILK